tara:strand:+ start:1247 stop:1609 length:363 start_codon:yes stop_codon:yes gene_type:complete
MKKLLIIPLLLILYSPAHAETFKPTYEQKLQSSVPEVVTPEQSSEKVKQLSELVFGGDLKTLESVCEYLGPIGVSINTVEEYQINKEVEKRLNALQRLTQYVIGLKIKADKLKKYYRWEF